MSSRTGFQRAAGGIRHLAIAAFLLAAVSVAAPAPARALDGPGGIGLRLVEAPVTAKDDPRARIYIVDHLPPGTVIERRVEVTNSTTSSHQVTLYSSAATIEDGVFVGAEGNTPNELSRWTTVTPGTVDLAAGEKRTAIVKIAVADDAAPGEQYAVVWAEARSDRAAGGVTQISRVGIRLYVSVGAGAPPAAGFAVEALTPARSAEGKPMVTATVRNTGGRALDVTGALTMSNGPGGLSAGPYPAELNTTLAIGDSKNVTITLDDRLPAGPWDAVVALESGFTQGRGEATITFPEAGQAAAVVTDTSSARRWLVVAGTAAAAMLIGFAGTRHIRRRRRVVRRHIPDAWSGPQRSLPRAAHPGAPPMSPDCERAGRVREG